MGKRKVTDEALDRLEDSVRRLVAVSTIELDGIREELDEQLARIARLEDVTAPGLGESDDLGEPRNNIDFETVPEDENTPAEPEYESYAIKDDIPAWDVTLTGARVYAAGGVSAQDTLNALLQAMVQGGYTDPSLINIHIGYVGTEPGFESEGGFDGLLTVGI